MNTGWKDRLREWIPPALLRKIRELRSPPRPYGEIDDPYLDWLCKMLGGWLSPHDGNIAAFHHCLRHAPPGGAFLEIGSFLGLSTSALSYLHGHRYRRPEPLFNCDPWAFEEAEELIGGFFDASSRAFHDYARDTFKRNLETFGTACLPHSFEATSDDFLAAWKAGQEWTDLYGRRVLLGGPLSFAYIDGAHTYEASLRDFLNVHEHLLPGGFVLLDDTNWESQFGCRRMGEEVSRRDDYEFVARAPNYLLRRRG